MSTLYALAHRWKQLHFADRIASAEQHHEPVDADPDATGGRHSVLERQDVVLVVGLRLLVAALAILDLLLEARALVVRIVQLSEGVREFHPARKALEAL